MAKRNPKDYSPETMRFLQAENPIGYNMALNAKDGKNKKSKPRYESDNMKSKNPRSKGR